MRLLSGCPGTIAGPVSPPLSRPSRESSRRPPFNFSASALWHLWHLSASSGRIFLSKKSTPSGDDSAARSIVAAVADSTTKPTHTLEAADRVQSEDGRDDSAGNKPGILVSESVCTPCLLHRK